MRPVASRSVAFQQVDVFSAVPFKGNPVAVILDGNGLTDGHMQEIARWTNLSETTFVCAARHPAADYRLRIFTPHAELPFAGHPTLGSAWALLQQGVKTKDPAQLMQECGQGLVAVRRADDRLFLALPPPTLMPVEADSLSQVAAALGIALTDIEAARLIDVGPVWLTLQLASVQRVMELKPQMHALAHLAHPHYRCVTVFSLPDTEDATGAVVVRSFAPSLGVPEDPVCGSGNGCVAALIRQEQLLSGTGYKAVQGQALGRDGHVHIEFGADGTIWVGGHAVSCITGRIGV